MKFAEKLRLYLPIICVMLLWGSMGIPSTYALQELTPLGLLCLRSGVAAALLPSVAGAGHVVFEDNGEAAYLVDAATSADIAAVTEKIEVLGGKVALAMKKLED